MDVSTPDDVSEAFCLSSQQVKPQLAVLSLAGHVRIDHMGKRDLKDASHFCEISGKIVREWEDHKSSVQSLG